MEEVFRDRYVTVFRGRDEGADESVIVELGSKELPDASEDISAALRAARSLVHPHLPLVMKAGLYRNRWYLVRKDVARTPVTQGSLSLREGASFLRDAALALKEASQWNVGHTDFRPESLLLNDQRRVFVTRLCYVPAAGPSKSPDSPYAAPEVRGKKRPDLRATVYSLGAVLYQLSAGEPPAPDPENLKPPSQVNPLLATELEEIILRAMDADPKKRYATPGEFANDLSRWLDGGATLPLATKAPVERVEKGKSARRKIPLPFVLAGAGTAALLFVFMLLSGGSDPEATSPTAETAAVTSPGSAPTPDTPAPDPTAPDPLPEPGPPPPPEPEVSVPEPKAAPPAPKPAPPEPKVTAPEPKAAPPEPKVAAPEPKLTPPPPKPAPPNPPPPKPVPPPDPVFTIRTVPKGALVSLDGRRLGKAPVTLRGKELGKRERVMRVELDGHRPVERRISASTIDREVKVVLKPVPKPAPKPVPKPPPPAPAPPAIVGTVEYIHPRYGVFVKLGPGQKVSKDQILTVSLEGQVAAELKVDRVTKPENLYPHGCAVCTTVRGTPSKGNEVRRAPR